MGTPPEMLKPTSPTHVPRNFLERGGTEVRYAYMSVALGLALVGTGSGHVVTYRPCVIEIG